MNEPSMQTAANPLHMEELNSRSRTGFTWQNVGLERSIAADIYFYLLAASWRKLLAVSFTGFLIINLMFATLYWFDLEGVANAQPGSFADAFFFSVQTFSTIGFGAMSPQSVYAHALVTVESFAGLVAVALATGLIYAKFSRPTAAIEFSEVAVIHDRNGVPHLHIRFANERRGEIINATIKASTIITEVTNEGSTLTLVRPLPLVTEDIPLFTMNWTAMHRLDENSPFYRITEMAPEERPVFFIVLTFEGMDSTMLQTVQARSFYRPQDILLHRQYKDMVSRNEAGQFEVNHQNLSKTEPVGGFQK